MALLAETFTVSILQQENKMILNNKTCAEYIHSAKVFCRG